ncbi:hypothetical protein QE152_g870 [Popillia japonica]|uniref:Uncharacterized protein n=1 Tax=Popillia japonica TaxID=7064 RepID=A0AAW1NB12_POPJA
MLGRLQRTLCIRVCIAYRTISRTETGVIAGDPPIEVMVKETHKVFNGRFNKDQNNPQQCSNDLIKRLRIPISRRYCNRERSNRVDESNMQLVIKSQRGFEFQLVDDTAIENVAIELTNPICS